MVEFPDVPQPLGLDTDPRPGDMTGGMTRYFATIDLSLDYKENLSMIKPISSSTSGVNVMILSLRNTICTAVLAAIAALSIGSKAFPCGGIFDVNCNLHNGGLSSGNIQRQGQIIINQGQHLLSEPAVVAAGIALEQYINASRNTAINGAMPIPPDMRARLTGYATESSMNRARYKIGDNGFVNLAHAIEQTGFASAVTLNDVIVFRGPSEASDPSIWAHELTHVDQYAGDGGVHSFAIRYVRNHNDLEGPAYAKGNGYWAWWQNQQAMAGNGMPPNGVPGGIQPARFGVFCYNQFGRFGPGQPQPLGAPCSINLPNGQMSWGRIGL